MNNEENAMWSINFAWIGLLGWEVTGKLLWLVLSGGSLVFFLIFVLQGTRNYNKKPTRVKRRKVTPKA